MKYFEATVNNLKKLLHKIQVFFKQFSYDRQAQETAKNKIKIYCLVKEMQSKRYGPAMGGLNK